jgi:hypothetical protein
MDSWDYKVPVNGGENAQETGVMGCIVPVKRGEIVPDKE